MKVRERVPSVLFLLLAVLYFLPLSDCAAAQAIQHQKPIEQQHPKSQYSAPQNAVQNPDAPPQGSISITAPAGGTTWHTGSYQIIQWSSNGTRSNFTNISLWKDDRLYAEIGRDVATGRTAYIVPFNAAAGLYELRVVNRDNRIQAKVPVTVAVTRVTLMNPTTVLTSGSQYPIAWTYSSSLAALKLTVLDSAGAVIQEIRNVPIGTGGQGKLTWTVPALPPGQSSLQCRFRATGTFHADVTNNNAWVDRVLSQSDLFTVRLPKISVGSFALSAKVAQCSPGRQYRQNWDSELNGRPVKVELCKANSGQVVHTIHAGVASHAKNSITWTAPNIPETLSREGLVIRITSLENPAVTGKGSFFNCERPGVTLVSPDPQKNLQMNRTYEIGWKYFGDPGPNIRVDLLSAKTSGYNMSVFETPAASIPIQGSGKWGEGRLSWTLTNRGPQQQFYIQLKGIENPNIFDRKRYYIGGSGGGSSSGSSSAVVGGSSSGTSTAGSGGSSSAGTSTSGTSNAGANACQSGETYQELLSGNKAFKYNATDSATFLTNSFIKLTRGGYVVEGYLALNRGPQALNYKAGKSVRIMSGSKVTFKNCCLASGLIDLSSNHRLEYRAGKSTTFLAGALTAFENGYVTSSLLSTDRDHTLEYRAGKSTTFLAGAATTFKDGYVASSLLSLAGDPTLEYRAGKIATFHRGAKATFKNGYVTSGILAMMNNQTLEYRPGRTAIFQNGILTTFNSTAVLSGQLALGSVQSLEYRAGKSAMFTGNTPITFRADGYVKSCQLANATSLEYAPGKYHTWPALTWPIFDDNGYTTTH